MNPVIFSISVFLRACLKVLIQVSLHTVFSFKLFCVILIIVPSLSKFIYCLTYVVLETSITRNQIYQASFTAVNPMICLKVWSLLQVIESASVMLSQTWHRLLLHLYVPIVLSNGYSLALTK